MPSPGYILSSPLEISLEKFYEMVGVIGSEEVFEEVIDDNGQVTQVSIRIPSKTDDNGPVTQVSSE